MCQSLNLPSSPRPDEVSPAASAALIGRPPAHSHLWNTAKLEHHLHVSGNTSNASRVEKGTFIAMVTNLASYPACITATQAALLFFYPITFFLASPFFYLSGFYAFHKMVLIVLASNARKKRFFFQNKSYWDYSTNSRRIVRSKKARLPAKKNTRHCS